MLSIIETECGKLNIRNVFSKNSLNYPKRHRRKLKKIVDRKKAIAKALKLAKKGDTVLIAGRGHEKFQDVAGKKIALDDREVVREILTS